MREASRFAETACLLAVVWLAACRTPGPPPPQLVPILGEEARIERWLSQLTAQESARQSVRLVGKLRIDGPGGTGGAKQVILAERPARLRFEALNFLGQTQTLLVTDGARFSFYDGTRLQSGPVTASVLLERLSVDLEPREAVRLLLGLALESGDKAGDVHAILGLGDDRVIHLSERRLRFDPAGELRAAASMTPGGELRWSLEYGAWRDVLGGRYPFAMAFYFPSTDLHARLELKEVELNPVLDPALFRVTGREAE